METMEKISGEIMGHDAAVLDAALRDKLLAAAPEAMGDTATKRRAFQRPKPLWVWGTVSAALVVWCVAIPVGRVMLFSDRSSTAATMAASEVAPSDVAMSEAAGGGMAKNSSMAPASAPPTPQLEARDEMQGVAKMQKMYTLKSASGGRAPSRLAPSSAFSRQVHRTADMSVEVQNAESASEAVERMVKETNGGYVAENQLTTNSDGTKVATMKVKVPVLGFEDFLSKVTKQGTVKSKNVMGEDITESMSNSKEAARSFTEQLAEARQRLQASRNRQDRYAVEREVRELRVEIAQTEGQLELLKKMAKLSDVALELHEKPKAQPQTGGMMDQIKETAQMAQEQFLIAVRLPIFALTWLVIYAPLWLVIVAGYRFVTRTSRSA
jgi:hypothetical protein